MRRSRAREVPYARCVFFATEFDTSAVTVAIVAGDGGGDLIHWGGSVNLV